MTFFELLPEEDLSEDMRSSLKLHEEEVRGRGEGGGI